MTYILYDLLVVAAPVELDVVHRVDHGEDLLPVGHGPGHHPLHDQVPLSRLQLLDTVVVENLDKCCSHNHNISVLIL